MEFKRHSHQKLQPHFLFATVPEKVSVYIDYPSVRQSFKEQVNAQVVKKLATEDSDGWEALGAMIATKMVEQIVDAVVTPEGMTMLLQGKNIKDSLRRFNDGRTVYFNR